MKKILVIEDDQSLASAYRTKLSNYFKTQSAYNGEDGLKKAKEWLPDLIILDLFLPEKSGQQVLTELRADEITNKIPVMVLTNLEGQCGQVAQLGANFCFVKTGITMEEIVKKIQSHLEKASS
jgi:DNA-binding response OmpR family regulator